MPDELFRSQTAQLETLLPKDETNNNGDIFKDQSALLESLPHKKSAENVPLAHSSRPPSVTFKPPTTEENNKRSNFSRIFNRLFVIVVFIVALIVVAIIGGVIFVEIEKADDQCYQPYPHCFKLALEKNATKNETVLALQECIKSKQKLSDLSTGSLFTWSLYTTIGYGHRFPFTFVGQLICVFFVLIFLPLYTAGKYEFGELLTLIIVSLGSKLKRLVIRFGPECLTKSIRKESYHPSDLTIVTLLFIICSIFILLLTVIVMYTSNLSFWKAFYLTIHTVLQVGLGDVTPAEEWPTFTFVIPLAFLNDCLASFLHFYIHGIYRLQMYRLAHLVSRLFRSEEDMPKGQELVMASSVADFVNITNHAMPLRATSHEIVRREVPDHHVKTAKSHRKKNKSTKMPKEKNSKVEEEGQLATPPESAKEDDTQELSQRFLPKKMVHFSREKVHNLPKSKEASQKTVVNSHSVKTVVEADDLKTPLEYSQKRKSWKGTSGKGKAPVRVMSHPHSGSKEGRRRGTREVITPLLPSTTRIDSQEKLGKEKSREKMTSKIEAKKNPIPHHPPPKKKSQPGQMEASPEQLKTSREPDKSWFEI